MGLINNIFSPTEKEIPGKIVETNAIHCEGSRVTFMEMDFGKLLEMPHQLEELNRMKPQGLEDAMELIKNVPGIKVDLNDEVIIKFR